MFVPRVTVPSNDGPQDFLLFGDPRFVAQEYLTEHDENRDNVVLLRCCWLSLLADSPFDTAKPPHVIRTFVRKLYDTKTTIAEFSALGDQVMKSEQIKEEGVISRTYIPAMMKTPVFREYNFWLKTGDTRALQYVLGFLKYGKKIAYKDDSLHKTALRGWVETECRLRKLELPPFVESLRLVCHWLFSDFEIDRSGIYPSHGNGAVSEKSVRGVHAKNQRIRFTQRQIDMYFSRSGILTDEDGTVIFNWWDVDTGDLGYPDFRGYVDMSLNQPARLMFVPKDFKKSRSICMEPSGYMYIQQAILWVIEQYLKTSKLRKFINLEDQGDNQKAAQYGSFTGCVDTIDLSSASDSVAWILILAIMPQNLLRHLAATRSDKVLLADNVFVEVSKFAPMGSALCFPVQCFVFAATIITVALIQALGRKLDDPTALVGVDLDSLMDYSFGEMGNTGNGKFEPPQIYGDDLCLDKRLSQNVVVALTALGFVVNQDKSFLGEDTFRESCGKYYSRGHDCSFILHSIRPLDEERICVETLGSVIALANRAHDFGYGHLRRCLINFALRHQFGDVKQVNGMNPVLFTEDKDMTFAIQVLPGKARNIHLRTRRYTPGSAKMMDFQRITTRQVWSLKDGDYNEYEYTWEKSVGPPVPTHVLYQRDEVQSITVRPCDTQRWDEHDENYAYITWWRSQRGRRDDLRISQASTRADRLGTVQTLRWTAA